MSDTSSVNDFQGQEVKSCEDKLGSSGNNVSNDQKILTGDAEFGSCKRSSSGQMLSNQTGDTGKRIVTVMCDKNGHGIFFLHF